MRTQILIKCCLVNSCWGKKSLTSYRLGRVCQSKWWSATVGCWKCCSINFKRPKTSTEPGSSLNAFTERLFSTINMSRRNHCSCSTFTGLEFRSSNYPEYVFLHQHFFFHSSPISLDSCRLIDDHSISFTHS